MFWTNFRDFVEQQIFLMTQNMAFLLYFLLVQDQRQKQQKIQFFEKIVLLHIFTKNDEIYVNFYFSFLYHLNSRKINFGTPKHIFDAYEEQHIFSQKIHFLLFLPLIWYQQKIEQKCHFWVIKKNCCSTKYRKLVQNMKNFIFPSKSI